MALAIEAASPLGPIAPTLRKAARAVDLVSIIGRLVGTARAEGTTAPDALASRAVRTARTLLRVHGVEVRSSSAVPEGAFVVAANHVSYLDPLVVSSVVPCISIAKGETAKWPLVGPGCRRSVSSSCGAAIRTAGRSPCDARGGRFAAARAS